jgi:hypothetical protein
VSSSIDGVKSEPLGSDTRILCATDMERDFESRGGSESGGVIDIAGDGACGTGS